MKSLVELLEHLLHDCGRRSGAAVSRDVETLRARCKHEGDSFITITLPLFCRDFERSLANGRLGPAAFLHFSKVRRGSGMPAFLQGFLSQVFASDGSLLAVPSIVCIRSIRQICLFGKKLERECSKERLAQAIENYKQCDSEVAVAQRSALWEVFRRVAAEILRDAPLSDQDVKSSIVPRHGPGATQEGKFGNAKWTFSRWHSRLNGVGLTHAFCMWGQTETPVPPADAEPEQRPCPDLVEPEDEKPVRVVFVPKTLKSPRVIAVEPVCMQFAQQGLWRVLERVLERNRYTRGHVNFRDQSVNQALAKDASRHGDLATLDMSDASDRVGVAHVETLLESQPEFLAMVLACRSTRAQLPNGEILTLKKFASMGSALCFPIEALVFYTSIIASRLLKAKVPVNAHSVRSFGRDVYVFGDDLIVPADEAPAICDDLEALGFKVNRHKSFWSGNFRESCGSDCFDNEDVTPVYVRHDTPTDRRDASALVSVLATANQLFAAGYYGTATVLREDVARILGKNSLPQVSPDSPALGWHAYSDHVPFRRWNRRLQREEFLCWTTRTPRAPDPLDGWEALAKCFRTIGASNLGALLEASRAVEFGSITLSFELPASDPEHLEVSPRRYSLTLKRSWVPSHHLS